MFRGARNGDAELRVSVYAETKPKAHGRVARELNLPGISLAVERSPESLTRRSDQADAKGAH